MLSDIKYEVKQKGLNAILYSCGAVHIRVGCESWT